MSQRPSATAIGAFVLGTIVLVVGSVVFFGGALLGNREDVRRAVVIFTGSVKGLNVGAPVTLRGVKIGDVKEIGISYNQARGSFSIPVTIEVHVADLGVQQDDYANDDFEPLIVRGLRAQLKTESLLTGLLYIDLGFLPGSTPRWGENRAPIPQLPTAPTEIEEILARVSSIDIQAFVQRADSTLRSLDALLNDPDTKQIPASLNATLAEARRAIINADTQIARLGTRVDSVADSAQGTLGTAQTEIAALGRHLDSSLSALDATLASLKGTSDGIDYALSDRSPALHQIGVAASEMGRAARALQELADGLAREPESLLRGRRDNAVEEQP